MADHKLYIITWEDSRRDDGFACVSGEDAKAYPLALIETVGYGWEEEDRYVLAQEFYPDGEHQKAGYRIIASIPKSCIKKVKELKP